MDFTQARKNMVDGQLTPNKITNEKLLTRYMSIPRELFVDVSCKTTAYADSDSLIHGERTMFSPLVNATLIQALNIKDGESVLIVAPGSGYSVSIVAGLTGDVSAVEDDLSLCEMARRVLSDVGCHAVKWMESNPVHGFEEKAPYDKILVDVAVDEISEALTAQLKNGGELVAVERKNELLFEGVKYTREDQRLVKQSLFETESHTCSNFKVEKGFEF